MARRKRWEETPVKDGVVTIQLSRWQSFYEYVEQELLDYTDYIYRGQSDAVWKLESSLRRLIRNSGQYLNETDREVITLRHLENFKKNARGRRGISLDFDSDENWWALGQHYGLATPLLDWTRSPFVAAYFAMAPMEPRDGMRCIFALYPTKSLDVGKLSQIEPSLNDNARLVAQSGLFTRLHSHGDVEAMVREVCKNDSERFTLIKIILDSTQRIVALRALNRMNINHATLFPDLYRAAKFSNNQLSIKDY
jgi:hypothetical protein